MISGTKCQSEIKFSVFTGLPFGGTNGSNLFTVDKNDTSSTKIGWSKELIGGLVFSDWEDDSVIVAEFSLDF